jgi:hypothetical protein
MLAAQPRFEFLVERILEIACYQLAPVQKKIMPAQLPLVLAILASPR